MGKKKQFYQSFLQLQTEREVKKYLEDLLTPAEVDEFTERLFVADLLTRNKTYAEIATKTSMSSTTVARVSKWLQTGPGGYKLILARLHHSKSLEPRL